MTKVVKDLDELLTMSGAPLGHSDWLAISQGRVDTFADATDDHQWIHVDPQRAADGPFGETIAHGYLTLALVIPLFTRLLEVTERRLAVNYGLNKVRFPAPVPVGSKIRLSGVIDRVTKIGGDCAELVVDFTVEVEGAPKPACVAQAVMRFYS